MTDSLPGRWTPAPAVRLSLCLHAAAFVGLIARPSRWRWIGAALAANHLLLGAAAIWPRSAMLGGNITRLPAASARRGEVALTFDDGPDPEVTPQVLDLLDQHGAGASFFCIGARAVAHPALVRAIRRRGHSVENHTFAHPYAFACFPPRRIRREIEAAQRAIAATAGTAPRFFRAPAGMRNPFLDPVLARTGLRYASWTRRGFDAVSGDPARVLRRVLDGLAEGDVILLHDGRCARTSDGQPVVLSVLPTLLTRLRQRGLRAVPLPAAFAGQEE